MSSAPPDFDALIAKHRLGHAADAIRDALAPALALVVGDAEPPTSRRSRFGGDALVADGFRRPEHGGRPLELLAQIDLRETSVVDPTGLLPTTGVLAVFYDIEEQPWADLPGNEGCFQVAHFEDVAALRPAPAGKRGLRPDPRRIAFLPRWTLPDLETRQFERALGDRLDKRSEKDDDYDRYRQLADELWERAQARKAAGRHQMLGHPYVVQGDMQTSAQRWFHRVSTGREATDADVEAGADDWLLLLQVDSGLRAGKHELNWGDIGVLYFWIRHQDLRDRRFDRTWMTLQCC